MLNEELAYIKSFMEKMDPASKAAMDKICDDNDAAVNLCPGFQDQLATMRKTIQADPINKTDLSEQVNLFRDLLAEHARALYSLISATSNLISVKGEFKMYCPGPVNDNYPVRLFIEYIAGLKKQIQAINVPIGDHIAPERFIEIDVIKRRITVLIRAIDILTMVEQNNEEFAKFEQSCLGSATTDGE
jgi:hypothetical protein